MVFHKSTPEVIKNNDSPLVVPMETTLSVTPKSNPTNPDLSLSNKYVAVIDNKEVTIPIDTTKVSKENHTATIQQKVDFTPVLKELLPDWEVGAGMGIHDGKPYGTVGLKRNYKINRAVTIEAHTDGSRVKGYEVMHWWN